MAKVPQPRRAGQVGGGGRIGHTSNRSASQARGGRPHAGGGGTGKKPPSGCSDNKKAKAILIGGSGLLGLASAVREWIG